MHFKIHHIVMLIATVLISVLIYGCTSLEDHQERGIAHYDAGRYEKAALEFKNIIKADKKNSEAHYRLALTEEKLGQWKSAFHHFNIVAQSNSKHVMARIKLAELYITAKMADAALKMADEIAAIDPGNSMALVLRAKSHELNNNLELAMESAKSAFDSEEKKSPQSTFLLATLHEKQGDSEKSIVVLNEGINHNPKDLRLMLLLANIHINQTNISEAKVLVEKINQSPTENVTYSIDLAQLYIRLDMLDDAERVLRASVERYSDLSAKIALIEFLTQKRTLDSAMKELQGFIVQFPNQLQLRFILARLYELNGQTDMAESEYRQIIAIDKFNTDGLSAKKKLASLLMKLERKDEAKKLIGEVLLQDPSNHEAHLILATIYIVEDNLELSLTEINKILKRAPDWLPALRLLANIHLKNNKPQLAEETLQLAVNVNPKDVEVQLKLAALKEAKGDTAGAIKQLQGLLHYVPDQSRALEALINLHIKIKNWDDARKTIAQYKAAYSKSAVGYFLSGLLYQAMGDVETSRQEFETSLLLQPTAKEPLTGLINSYTSDNKVHLAIDRIQEHIKNHPSAIFAYLLLGDTQWSDKRYKEAEASFRKVIELRPKWSAPYASLGDKLLQSNKPQDALKVYQQGIEKSSDKVAIRLKLSFAYEQLGEYDLAIQEYEKIPIQDPAFDIVANNLSMLLVTHKNTEQNLQRALALVQRFTDSEVLAFRDTLAWVHYINGDIDVAISYLTNIVEKAPQIAEYHYHLGMAFYKKGYKKLARHHLQKALKDKPAYQGVEEARATLSKL